MNRILSTACAFILFLSMAPLSRILPEEPENVQRPEGPTDDTVTSDDKKDVEFYADEFAYFRKPIGQPPGDKNREDNENHRQTIDIMELRGHAVIQRTDRVLKADRIRIVGSNMDRAYAYGHVHAYSEDRKNELFGGYGELYNYPEDSDEEDFIRISRNPTLIYRVSTEDQRKSGQQQQSVKSEEPYKITVRGKVFTRYNERKLIEIEGPVSFSKSNEYMYGSGRQARYSEEKDMLELSGNCRIIRGDDLYIADTIEYYSKKKLLILDGNVHLMLFDYRLDPFHPSYQDPFSAPMQGPTSKENNESPFRYRKYSVLKRLFPATQTDRYRLRKFMESQVHVYGTTIHYDRSVSKNPVLKIHGDALIYTGDGFFNASFLEINGDGYANIYGSGNVYAEQFSDGSFSFGDQLYYFRPEKWGRISHNAHLIIPKNNDEDQRYSETNITHVSSDQMERDLQNKRSYMKGHVTIHHNYGFFQGILGRLREDQRILTLLGAPEIHETSGSNLFGGKIILYLNEKEARLNSSIHGMIYQTQRSEEEPIQFQAPLLPHRERTAMQILKMGTDNRIWGIYSIPYINF